MKYTLLSLIILTALPSMGQLQAPKDLRTEYLKEIPLIDIPKPRLGWINEALNEERGQTQTAWEIRVSDSKESLEAGNLWQSGKINSIENQRIEYAGKPLKSRQQCWWQVRTWDKNGKVSAWSEPATWRMGILDSRAWKAQWIGSPWQGEEAIPKPPGGPDNRTEILPPPAPYLRKTFEVKKPLKNAVVFTTGLGYFEFYANGNPVSEDKLVPNQTNYGKRPELPKAYISVPDEFAAYKVMYLAYDITGHLKQGKNAIGALLGNGFYNDPKFWTASYGSPRFIAQLHLTYEDGTEEVVISDTSWKAEKSPILVDLVYDGEIYDARKEIKDWCKADFDDADWQHVVLREAPFGDLRAHTAETDRVTKTYRPVAIEKLGEGHFKVSFPEEISGWVRFNKVRGPAGQKVHLTFNANLYSGENTYYFAGKGEENYAPRFNWFVFSGVEITGWPGELTADMITAEAVNTATEENAVFETSNELFNQINHIWKRSQMDNMHGGIASDCPHRERSGYTGDAQVACPTVMHNFDARAFYQKWVADMREAQLPETGYIPNGAPWQPGCGGGVAWGAAICIIPWEFYLQYGAKDMLSDNYEAMKGYIRYMQTWVDKDGVMFSQRTGHDGKPLKWWNLGDWAGVCEDCLPDDALVHTFYYWYSLDITAKVAAVLGDKAESDRLAKLAEETRKAFHNRFFDNSNNSYGNYGSNVFALKMGVPQSVYENVIETFQKEISGNGGHLNTGIFGTRFFFEVLAENGLNNLAYEAMNKRTEPSFGQWLELGSTTTREHWSEKGSYNHPMFGGGLVWLYQHLAGMKYDEKEPGYRYIVFQPKPTGEMDNVNYETYTPQGKAGIHWKRLENGNIKVHIQIPVGCKGTFISPSADFKTIRLDGKKIRSDKLKLIGSGKHEIFLEF